MTAVRPAIFLDRDGTLIEDTGYLSRAEDVRLLDGVGDAIRALNDRDVPAVIISNQSGIGRGKYSVADFEAAQARLIELLAAQGSRINATYICPHTPDDACECRKPQTLLYRRAIADLQLDVTRSWYVGDRWRDLAASKRLGGSGILFPSPATPAMELEEARERALVCATLNKAVAHALGARSTNVE